jgi:hypothetical protein
VGSDPAGKESIVARFISWLKVADAAMPATILLLLLMLVGPSIALLLGVVKMTAGVFCADKVLPRPVQPAESIARTDLRECNNAGLRFNC